MTPVLPAAETSELPPKVGVVTARRLESIMSRPIVEPPDLEEQARREASERRIDHWRSLIKSVGDRYRTCRLENFELSAEEAHRTNQQDALQRLGALRDHMREHVSSGGNVILYGPPGTGKDHLLVALLHCAIGCDFKVDWRNGQDLFGDFRDRIDTNRSEESSIRQYEMPHILAISDPVPPKGSASDFTTTMLYRIIDRRYRCLRSTWITANVAKADEARAELSGPIFDRLSDNCLAVFCNWPSYRRSRKPEWLK